MDDHTRDLFERCVQRLKEYRDVCEDEGMTALVKPLDRLCEEVQVELDTAPRCGTDPSMTIRLVDDNGDFFTFQQLQHNIYRKVMSVSKSMVQVAHRLNLGRSSLYRHNEIYPLIRPERMRVQETA